MDKLLKRIDEIARDLDNIYGAESSYREHVYEIKQIILSTVGEKSDSYDSYASVLRTKMTFYEANKYLIGVLRGLKEHLQLQAKYSKRYQVFVSSTYRDLIDFRRVAFNEISFLDCVPAGMEDFTACGEDLETYIKGVIDESDYYVLIIGQRFGSHIPTDVNVSYTMMEYEYAKSKGMRIIPFIYNGTRVLDGNDLDANKEKFDKFVSFVSSTVPQYFKDEIELGKKLIKALSKEMRDYPQKGWIRL